VLYSAALVSRRYVDLSRIRIGGLLRVWQLLSIALKDEGDVDREHCGV
jgi:hypothetical protein